MTEKPEKNYYQLTERTLSQYKNIKAHLVLLTETLAYVRSMDPGPGGINMDGMPGGSMPGDPTGRHVITKLDAEERILAMIQKHALFARNIEVALDALNPIKKRVVLLRYFDRMAWDEVAEEVNYSEQYCRRIRSEAINELKVAVFGMDAIS